jgi:hypothetical protein
MRGNPAFPQPLQWLDEIYDFRSTTSAAQTAMVAASYFPPREGLLHMMEKQPRPKTKNNKSQTATMGQRK